MTKRWLPSIPPRLLGVIQLALFVGSLYIASFGGVLIGFAAPGLVLGGKGLNNLFTRSS